MVPTALPSGLRAVVLNAEGRTSGELAAVLKAPRSKISVVGQFEFLGG